MFSLKPFLGQSKPVNRDLVVVSLICGIAYLAGKEKQIQVFKSANLGGRIAAATAASVGLGVASKTLERSEGDKQSIEALVTKVLAITMSCVVLTSIVSKQAPKIEISFADARKFAFLSASMMLASEIRKRSRSGREPSIADASPAASRKTSERIGSFLNLESAC